MDIFDNLVSENDGIVEQTLNGLKFIKVDTIVNAYLLNIYLFHRNIKIRNLAKKKLLEFNCEDLIVQAESNWQKEYLKEQEYFHKKLYENPLVDSAEYLAIAQATRRNYFFKYKKSKFISLAHMRYDDDIENIFDCYQVQLERISENIQKLKHITVANFNNQTKLNFEEVVGVLSKLPDIHFLQIAKSNLIMLPKNLNELKSLRRLSIEYNPIDSLGDYKSDKLERLEIKGTKISEIDLNNFPNLKELWVDDANSKNRMNLKNRNGRVKLTSGRMYSEMI